MSGEGHKFLYFDPGKTGEFMEKESFPSNVEFNTADLGAEQPAGDASFETLTEDAASEAPIAEAPSEIDIVKGAMAEESGDDIDKIINQSEKAPEKSLVKKALALALAGSAIIGAGCGKDKDKNTKSTADPTSGTPKTESVSTATDSTSERQDFSSGNATIDQPLSEAPTSETEKVGGKHAVVIKAEGQVREGVTFYESKDVEVEPGLGYQDFLIENPLDPSMPALDIVAFLEALGVNRNAISTSDGFWVGNKDTDLVAFTFDGNYLKYYVNGKAKYAYHWDGKGVANDGVDLYAYDEGGTLTIYGTMHQDDVMKAIEVNARAFVNQKTTSPYELGES